MSDEQLELLKKYIVTSGLIDFYDYDLDIEEDRFEQVLNDLLSQGFIYVVKDTLLDKHFRKFPYFQFENNEEIPEFILCRFKVNDYIQSENFKKLFHEQKNKTMHEIKKSQDRLKLLNEIEDNMDDLSNTLYHSNTNE